jgi:Peptidase family C50
MVSSSSCGSNDGGDDATTTAPATVPLALGATAKLAAHVPEPYGVHLLATVILNCPAIASSLLERKQSTSTSSAPSSLEILNAALSPGNALRKRLATLIHGPTDAIIDTLGGEDACLEAAAALEVVARTIGVGYSCTSAAAPATSSTLPFSDYAHSAAAALACSARIRCAPIHKGFTSDWPSSFPQAAETVLGWRWPNFQSFTSSPINCCPLLSTQELIWLSSSLYNVGIDLLTRGTVVESSIEPLTVSLVASITALSLAVSQESNKRINNNQDQEEEFDSENSIASTETLSQGVNDIVKRASVVIEALAKAGREATELTATAADVVCAVFTTCPMLVSSPCASTLVNSLVSATVKQQVVRSALSVCPPSFNTKRQGGRSRARTTTTAPVAAASISSQSLTAAVQNQPEGQMSKEVVSMVARAELVSWAEAISTASTTRSAFTEAEAAAAAAAQHLLDIVYPSNTAPLDHARTLLLLEKLNFSNLSLEDDKKQKETCIVRAKRVLQPLIKNGDVEALIVDALIAAHGVLSEAQALVEASIDHQKILQQEELEKIRRNPSEVHADENNHQEQQQGESFSAAAATAAFAENQAAEWSGVLKNASDAIKKLCEISQRFSSTTSSSSSSSVLAALFKQDDGKALIAIGREVATLVGIYGLVEQERKAVEALLMLENTSESGIDTISVLQECVLPAFDASADGAVLEAAATDLAVAATASSRSPAVVMQRAELSIYASLAYAASGAVVKALYCAGEGHRLLGSLIQIGDDGVAARSKTTNMSLNSTIDGWWKFSVTYCRSLLLVGRLFDSAGMMDEALLAIKEGQSMAEAMGSLLLSAAFTSQLAQIYAISGQFKAASIAIHSAKKALESLPSSVDNHKSDSIVQQWAVASVACAETRVHAATGEYTQAMLCCHTALDALEEAQDCDANKGLKPHVDALLAAVHCARLEVLKAEGREVEEIGNAAKRALGYMDDETCMAFGAAPRAGLLLTQAAAVAAAAVSAGTEKFSSSSAARLWVPTAAAEDVAVQKHSTYLWQALLCSRAAPHVHRFAAFKLAPLVASSGHLHLAALLLHMGAGSTLQLQHQLVLHARERNAQRRQRASASTLVGAGRKEAESAEAAAVHALNVLDSDLDWELIRSVLATDKLPSLHKAVKQVTTKRGGSKRGATKPSCTSTAPEEEEEVLAALATLNTQAAQTLYKWLSLLPSGTPVCTVGSRDDQDCLVVSRLSLVPAAAGGSDDLQDVVVPIIVDIPIEAYSASSSQHPIRALALDKEDISNKCSSLSAVASAVHEMERVLEDSTHSMKSMATDTRDQQREWWRTRVELDDSLAALLQHLGEEWLGPWKCLLIGSPLNASSGDAKLLRERLSTVLEQLISMAEVDLQIKEELLVVVNELAITIAHSMQSMNAEEQRQAAITLCTALLGVCGKKVNDDLKMEMVAKAVKLLIKAAVLSSSSTAAAAAQAILPPATLKKTKAAAAAPPPTTRKVTFFQDDDEISSSPSSSPEPRTQLRQAPSFYNIDIDNGLAAGGGGSNLCARFEALEVASMATPLPARTPGGATIRAKKHKSRLTLMQGAVTPAAKSARKPLCPTTSAAGGCLEDCDATSSTTAVPATIFKRMNNIAAVTAPRMRRPVATPATAFTMPARARNLSSSSANGTGHSNAAPVVAIFSPELQSLPWESAPGLVSQQIYRLHALPCAAATASSTSSSSSSQSQKSKTAPQPPKVNLSSAYYTINPSGDLQTTQDTFEAWFKSLRGWSGHAGSPPSSSELAHALQSKELFVYCGHGGGEQYIPTAKLRGLPRCAASLLMGCSSGRLRGGEKTNSLSSFSSQHQQKQQQQQQQHFYYEPTGVVLAYLLAGCPAAVANLWDVTDRDIDRFAQAVLLKWLGGSENSSGSSSGGRPSNDVAAAVALARGACKLPCLIGAAPVCYGVPTTVVSQ